jgi:hypothetical protein
LPQDLAFKDAAEQGINPHRGSEAGGKAMTTTLIIYSSVVLVFGFDPNKLHESNGVLLSDALKKVLLRRD